MSTNMRDEAVQKRCVPTPGWTGARMMAIGMWRTDYPMAIGIKQTRIRLMAIGTQRSGDNLDTEATRSCQQKNDKNIADGDQTDGYKCLENGLRAEG